MEKFHEFDPDFKKVVNNTLELKEDMTSLSQKRRKGYAYDLNRMKNQLKWFMAKIDLELTRCSADEAMAYDAVHKHLEDCMQSMSSPPAVLQPLVEEPQPQKTSSSSWFQSFM